jgi:hypothetical protein
MKLQVLCIVALTALGGTSFGQIVWTEDFSDVTDWSVVFDSGGGANLTSDGNLGLFNVPAAGSEAAFAPIPGVAPMIEFVLANQGNYSVSLSVPTLTDSMSYELRIDQFDANTNYLSTVLGVLPQGTFTGSTNISLASFTFNGSAAYLLPKVEVFTGNGNQTVSFDELSFSVIPEPSSAALVVVAGLVFGLGLRRRFSQR